LEDSRRFRIELMFSSGAALSPLEVTNPHFIVWFVVGCSWTFHDLLVLSTQCTDFGYYFL
jgi:hypothetical protein